MLQGGNSWEDQQLSAERILSLLSVYGADQAQPKLLTPLHIEQSNPYAILPQQQEVRQ